jgi:hypothetical protein
MQTGDAGGLLSLVLVYLGGYFALVLFAVCLATGLYYIAELVEEYSRTTKRVLKWALLTVLALHAALLVFDRQPASCVLAGAAAHVAYARLLPRFPHLALASPEFALAFIAFLASNALWLRHFYYDTYASAEYVAGFCSVCAWLVPFGFFISLAANDSVLPTGTPPPYAAAALARDAAASRARNSGMASGGGGGSGGGGMGVGVAFAPAEERDAGGGRKRSRNIVAGAIGGVLRWVRGRRGGLDERPGRSA